MTMKTTLRTTALLAVTALTLGGTAQAADGLQRSGPDDADVERARELVVKARQASENLQAWDAAHELYRKAAELFGNSSEAADAWARAGLFAFYGEDNRATSDFQKAGEIAMEHGRVAFAAKAFLDGAWVADRTGMKRIAYDLAVRGERLARSPLLAEAERARLQSRLESSGDGVGELMEGPVVRR
jgi:tetratricopeptide (TPR) repeat protein